MTDRQNLRRQLKAGKVRHISGLHAFLDRHCEELMVIGCGEIQNIFVDDCTFDEAWVLAVLRFSDEQQAFELEGEDEDVIRECEHDELALRAVIDDIVINIQILFSEWHCQLVHH